MLEECIEKARKNMLEGVGGPFGAAIVDKDENVISVSSNSVLKDNDPTAHAEVNAIREACKKLNTNDLSNYILYTTCYPCPMCMSAAIWANISKVYYFATKEDAEKIGFRDNYIYKFIENGCIDKKVIDVTFKESKECAQLFEEYKRIGGKIY